MRFFVFGNPDFQFDSLPRRILPGLKRRFPDIEFEIKDPNEEFEIPEELAIIDTVSGIDKVEVFSDLSHFSGHSHVSLHDFDLYSHLKHLEKLGKLKKINPVRSKTPQASADSALPNRTSNGIKIIGIPPTMSEREALEGVAAAIYPVRSKPRRDVGAAAPPAGGADF